jgi:hypothetical protein
VVIAIGALAAGYGGFRHDGLHGAGFNGQARFGGRFRGQRLFSTFDTDNDDVLTQPEVYKARGLQFAKFDKDGDGKVTRTELRERRLGHKLINGKGVGK